MHSADPNLQDLSPEEKQAFNRAQNEALTFVVDQVLDEIPIVGEVKDIINGESIGTVLLGIIPFGKKVKTIVEGVSDVKKSAKKITKTKAENLKNAESKGIPKSQLGPSGKPKIHNSKQSTEKRAKDAARNNPRSNTAPIKDTSNKGQKTHYHSTRDGQKMKGKNNTHYTDESSKKNQGSIP